MNRLGLLQQPTDLQILVTQHMQDYLLFTLCPLQSRQRHPLFYKVSQGPRQWRFYCLECSVQFSSVAQSCPTLCNTMIAAHQASLSITNSRNSPRLTSIESVIHSSHFILCRPLLLLPPIFPSIRVFSSESTLCMRWPKYWSFNFSIIPSRKISISALLTTPKPLCGSQ